MASAVQMAVAASEITSARCSRNVGCSVHSSRPSAPAVRKDGRGLCGSHATSAMSCGWYMTRKCQNDTTFGKVQLCTGSSNNTNEQTGCCDTIPPHGMNDAALM